ncbi:MAG: nucleotidyltransferase domain-containing protein [Oscillospiraceae bacterium]|nr:nucleotidyltransferase domain-containing protein [Oscillospiraceae bacterium]
MTIEQIKAVISEVAMQYSIKNVKLFGSRADGTNKADSDVDLIVEFSVPVTLITISSLQCRLEEMLRLDVDIIHGPVRDTDLIEIGKEIEIYAA